MRCFFAGITSHFRCQFIDIMMHSVRENRLQEGWLLRIFRYIFQHKVALILVFLLLIGQALCDLALPKYTSDIVDIGIQQSGVEHVACEVMTAKTHDELEGMLSGEDATLFNKAYSKQNDGLYALTQEGRNHIDALDALLAMPLIRINAQYAAPDAAQDGDTSSYAGEDQNIARADNPLNSMVNQRAISASIAEYERAGYSLSDMQMSYLVRVGFTMAGIAAIGMLLAILVGYVASKAGARIGHTLREKLFSQVVSFSENEINRFSAASLITRGTNDIQLVQNVSIMLMRMVLYAPILALGGIVMVMITNASLGWVIVVAIICVFATIGVLFKVTLPRFKIMQKLIDNVNRIAREILTGMPVIRAFDRQTYEEMRFNAASEDLMKTQLFTNRAMSFMMPAMMLIMNATAVAIIWFGGFYVQEGTIQTGDLIAFITYAMVIIMGFLMLGMVSIMLPRANVAAERVAEVIACVSSVQDPTPSENQGSTELHTGTAIEFDNVSFCYDEGDECEDVLHEISFTALPGQTIAIIGATGSGKSTILKLIERFYDVTAGSVRINHVDVRDMPQADLRSHFGYVPQKAFLFSGTIASNVAYSDEHMDEGSILKAIDIAQAQQFVSEKEEGLQFPIAQGGTNVSGGQRQRLAIARAVATCAPAFLFDDSFSALDYKTDAELRSALAHDMAGSTQIIVAQRIASVMSADKIIVLDEGRIVGQGTHEELLAQCEEYREIASSQLSEDELASTMTSSGSASSSFARTQASVPTTIDTDNATLPTEGGSSHER